MRVSDNISAKSHIDSKYAQHRSLIKCICVVLLLLYPMINVMQGLSSMDTTYSPGNFLFHKSMNGTWIVATYLANALGHLITCLPGGSTLLGMNIYTSLIVGATAVMVFCVMSPKFGIYATFIGEVIAIGLCWCPTTILYNYLTYFLMTAGVLLVYVAVTTEDRIGYKNSSASQKDKTKTAESYAVRTGKENGKSSRFGSVFTKSDVMLAIAGFILGSNVITRLPNVTEAAFILIVWYAGFLKKEKIKTVILQTLYCIIGYAIGFGIWFAVICIRFGTGAYGDMIHALFAMTDTARDYKPLAMVEAFLSDYIYAAMWIGLWCAAFAVCCAAGYLLNRFSVHGSAGVKQGDTDPGSGTGSGSETVRISKTVICGYIIFCLAVFVLVIRICYGQGMFWFRYYEYGSMYFWAVLVLFATTVICICEMICGGTHRRIPALMILLIMYVTCLGSNNGLYPSVNNMFIVAPYFVWIVFKKLQTFVSIGFGGDEVLNDGPADVNRVQVSDEDRNVLDKHTGGTGESGIDAGCDAQGKFRGGAWFATGLGIMMICLLIQSAGFITHFAFGDGVDGEPRDSYVTGYDKTAHIKTTASNAQNLQGLMDYMYSDGRNNTSVILYGGIPGIGYILDMPSAITTFWPDLDSYNYYEWAEDLQGLYNSAEDPAVITSLQTAAWMGQDAAAIDYFGIDRSDYENDKKLADLMKYMDDKGYEQVYSNEGYAVYMTGQGR